MTMTDQQQDQQKNNHQQQQQQQHQCKRRIVAHSGPPKTGSTSMQAFFGKNWGVKEDAINLQTNDGTVSKWKYPFRDHRHCMYFEGANSNDMIKSQQIVDKLKEAAGRMKSADENMFVLCETFAWVPPNHRYFVEFMYRLQVDLPCLEFVLSFRTPRVEHWLSHYNQMAKLKNIIAYGRSKTGNPLKQYVCSGDVQHNRAIDTFRWASKYRNTKTMSKSPFPPSDHSNAASTANSTAENLVPVNWPVTIIGMPGVAKAGRDMSHVIACDVLMDGKGGNNASCTEDGWIVGVDRTPIRENTRNREIKEDMTDLERERIDYLLRVHDCTYREELRNDPMVRILYSEGMWEDCVEDVDYSSVPSIMQLRDDEYFLHALQSVMGCENSRPYEEIEAELAVPSDVVKGDDAALLAVHHGSSTSLENVTDVVTKTKEVTVAKLSEWKGGPDVGRSVEQISLPLHWLGLLTVLAFCFVVFRRHTFIRRLRSN